MDNLGPATALGRGAFTRLETTFLLFKNLGRHRHLKKTEWRRVSTPSSSRETDAEERHSYV